MSKALESSRETDVAVVGYGGAGAAAAIAAADLGAKVVIVEKASQGGGNTRLSAGSIRTFGAVSRAVEHITFLCGNTTDPELIETFVRESHDNEPWLRSLGGEIIADPIQAKPTNYPVYPSGAGAPEQPGADGVGPRLRVKGETTANGRDLWDLLARNVADRGIPVLLDCPAVRLLRDATGAVTGVVARHCNEEIVIRVRKGLILSCGGYEWDSSSSGPWVRPVIPATASAWPRTRVRPYGT